MSAVIRKWVSERLPSAVESALRRLARTDDARHIAVMPDVHLAHDVCIGTVLGTSQLVYPDAVGGDIGCGMAAIAMSGGGPEVLDRVRDRSALFDALRRAVPIIRHPPTTVTTSLPVGLDVDALSDPALQAEAGRDGLVKFATLGRGNHFLELQADDDEGLWLMIHSGSRAMGQAIREHHLEHAVRSSSGLRYLDTDDDAGRAYVSDMEWARSYARLSRRAMLEAAASALAPLLGVEPTEGSWFDSDHNHVQPEEHFGGTLWIHRKGAMAADDRQRGIVPGSMADPSYHVLGRGVEDALRSCAHGAGRVMSREEARRRVSMGALRSQLVNVTCDERAIKKLRDEAPAAYKDIRHVMRAQRKLVRIERTLRPVLSFKGA